MRAGNQQDQRPDPATLAGTGEALRSAYRPDAAADARVDQLLERLKRLPWNEDEQDKGEDDAREA